MTEATPRDQNWSSEVIGILEYEQAPSKPRDHVTMNRPLEPWPATISFHRTLAFHLHAATRVARNNNGIAETEDDAMRFDLPPVDYEKAGQ